MLSQQFKTLKEMNSRPSMMDSDILKSMSKDELISLVESMKTQIGDQQRSSAEIQQPVSSALNGFAKRFEIDIVNNKDPVKQLTESKEKSKEIIDRLIASSSLKLSQTIKIEFEKTVDKETITQTAHFNSKPVVVTNTSQTLNALDKTSSEIQKRVENWVSNGSNWQISKVLEHMINLYKYEPVHIANDTEDQEPEQFMVKRASQKGSSYLRLPKALSNSKKGLINLQNMDDQKCFLWCHVRFLKPASHHPGRITADDRKFAENLNYEGVSFPVALGVIPRIEHLNDIKVNVFGYETGQFFPLHIGEPSTSNNVMNLLLISDGEGSNHYVLINSLDSLFYHSTKHGGKRHFCHHCIQGFSSEEILKRHLEQCMVVNGAQATELPKPGTVIKFKNYHKQLQVPFIIYADFESILEPTGQPIPDNKDKSFTTAYENHKCCGFAYKVVCSYDQKLSKPYVLYRGEGVVNVFLKHMLSEEEWCSRMMEKHFKKELRMSAEDERLFKSQTACHICDKELNAGDKVRDHCHYTGKFRGSAHQSCNAVYRLSKTIPVVFHNLRGYDSHFLVLEMGNFKRQIGIIPNNFERYMTISWGKLRFIDSFQFMSSGLDKLVANLPVDSFINTDTEFKGANLELVKRKGVYPYEYFDSMDRFNERRLPPKSAFYNKLNNVDITDADYEHAKNVWKRFKMKTLGEYHDLYLATDTVLLADVFEKFRKVCLSNYGLDPAHYLSSPGLSWDAMLKQSGVTLELISDIDQYQMVEKGMRGGVSYIAHRSAKANNEMMSDYDGSKPNDWIMYLDANNLYGWAMSNPLPVGDFRFLEQSEIDRFDLKSTDDDRGYYLEVDLRIPEDLHDYMSDYPIAPEKRVVTDDILSNYCKNVKEKIGCDSGKVEKLLTTLLPKENYVLHYKNLKLYLNLGAELVRIHRILEFREETFLKGYIDLNTQRRAQATNSFEKDFYKLMNNAVYGKTCENLRKRVDIRLVNNESALKKMVCKPTFVGSKIFTENLVAVHRVKKSLVLNKPSYVGCAVLELSKCLMYDFHYNWIKRKYGDRAKLLFTDTDSLTYIIRTNNIYDDMWADRSKFDFSDYPKDSPYFSSENKKVIGKMKDECGGVVMDEFLGLRSKMYSYTKVDPSGGKSGDKKAKGVKKGVVKKSITHEDFKNTLEKERVMRHRQRGIRSDKHRVASYEMNKISLSCFDDKRYILEDGISSLPYGHYKTGVSCLEYNPPIRRTTKAKGPLSILYPMTMLKYGKAILNAKPEDLFVEYVNPPVLRCILDNWDTISKMGKKERKKVETDYLRRVLTIIDQVNVDGFFLTTYYSTDCSRLYAVQGISLQTCWRFIRQALSFRLYTDIDMVNAHPTLLLNMAEECKIKVPFLREYVEDRDKLITDVRKLNPQLNRDTVKRNILAVLNGGQSKYIGQFLDQTHIKGFAEDARKMRNHFAPNKSFKDKKQAMSYAMTDRENLLLVDCVKKARGLGIEVMVLIFDGFQVPKHSDVVTLLEEINGLDRRVRFKEKGFNECDELMTLLKSHGCKFRDGIPKNVPSNDRLLGVVGKYVPPNVAVRTAKPLVAGPLRQYAFLSE